MFFLGGVTFNCLVIVASTLVDSFFDSERYRLIG